MAQRERPLDHTASMPAWFGVELRNWRKTRGLSTAALGAKVNLSKTQVERIEKAERGCTTAVVHLFDEALGAGGALLRLWDRVEHADKEDARADTVGRTSSVDRLHSHHAGMMGTGLVQDLESAVDRRAFLAASGTALSPASLADLLTSMQSGATELPKRVRPDDIEQIRTAARSHALWDNRFGGGGLVRATAAGQLDWAMRLLNVPCPPGAGSRPLRRCEPSCNRYGRVSVRRLRT